MQAAKYVGKRHAQVTKIVLNKIILNAWIENGPVL
jgi:hypothetical protein